MSQRIILVSIGEEVQLGCMSMHLLLLSKMKLYIEESTLYSLNIA